MIEARVICDSVSPTGKRLTTLKLRYPKFVHGELMTHRVFSRNASSSRAIPTTKLLEEVRSDALRAVPLFWGKNQPGMQADEELSRTEHAPDAGPDWGAWYEMAPYYGAKLLWDSAAHKAADVAEQLLKLGAHKQLANRLLEPFSHINVVVTATEFDNFFGLRLDMAAQPEMRALAIAMYEAMARETPDELPLNCWHLPFVDPSDFREMGEEDGICCNAGSPAIKVSVARCARVSYESFETGRRSTIEEDLALYDRLVKAKPGHLSPTEHQATPDDFDGPMNITCYEPTEEERKTGTMRTTIEAHWANPAQHGNFSGWRQYRKMIEGEAVAPLPEEYRP